MGVVSMKQLLEAGVHFGHQTRRWNPKMAPYTYTERNGIHIIDLQKTVGMVDDAYKAVADIVANGGSILFVGTKKQAQDAIKEEAERCGMFYVNERWLGGMLTNFKTIQSRIKRLQKIEEMSQDGTFDVLPKKEVIAIKKEWEKLEKNLGGIKEMKKLPDAIIIIDPKKERICVAEAHALNIPLLNEQLTALFNGEEVELPKYNFQTGKSEKSGRRLRLNPHEILVVEGIHALNPELTAQIPEEQKYRIYASALTTILLDKHNYIPTTDNRLLRRIIRDHKYRGVSAQETIRRWPSVRAGENKWIFPFQENADAMFNTAMIYELAVITGDSCLGTGSGELRSVYRSFPPAQIPRILLAGA